MKKLIQKPIQAGLLEEPKVGFMNNLTAEEMRKLEEKKAKAAHEELLKREVEDRIRQMKEKNAKKIELELRKKSSTEIKFFEENSVLEDDGWWVCDVCDGKKMNSIQAVEMHCSSDFHKRRLTKLKNEKNGISETEIIKTAEFSHWPNYVATRPYDYYCMICEAPSTSKESMDMHLKGKQHAKRLRMAGAELNEPHRIGVHPAPANLFSQAMEEEPEFGVIEECEVCRSSGVNCQVFKTIAGLAEHYIKVHRRENLPNFEQFAVYEGKMYTFSYGDFNFDQQFVNALYQATTQVDQYPQRVTKAHPLEFLALRLEIEKRNGLTELNKTQLQEMITQIYNFVKN